MGGIVLSYIGESWSNLRWGVNEGEWNNLMLGSLKDCLGRLDEGIWAVSSCLTELSLRITFGGRFIRYYGSKRCLFYIVKSQLYAYMFTCM